MMTEKVDYVQLLGRVGAQVGQTWLPFAPDKRYQLLAYLAYSGDSVSRERVAYLFWPDTTTERAQQNLRGLLHRVRALDWLAGLEVDAHRLCWPVETDTKRFQQALERGPPDEVMALYQGALLEGLGGDEATEFSSWLEIEREHLHVRWRDVLLRRAQELREQKEYKEAAKLLSTLLDKDPLDEEALAVYLNAANSAGQREQALKSYRDFEARLRQELDIEPASSTQRLAQAIGERGGEALEQATVDPLPSPLSPLSLPTSLTSFVGRDVELSEIAHLLAERDCRLLTLTGPGGTGKTRLALRAAQELARDYADGVYFVALDSLSSSAFIPASIARVLGLELKGQDDPLGQLIHHIDEKRALLVLDNYEHLLDGATLASQLIQSCANLKVLVTSRERLGLAEEWLLPIEGLPYPASPLIGGTKGGWPDFDAVVLFLQRARQVRLTFSPTDEDVPYIVKICQLVEGLPLGIELAAVWVRMMSPADIAREIQESVEVLGTSARNVPERHRSIRATFEHSWSLMRPVEQEVLRKLSVFRGGFKKEAAAVVAGTSIAVLISLIDKSLLRVSASGRYDRHPLIYQYTQEKLAERPEEEARAKEKHAHYFLDFAERAVPSLRGAAQRDWLSRLELEHDNLRAAMAHYLEVGAGTLSLRLGAALHWFWVMRGHFREGRRWLTAALGLAGKVEPAPRATALSAAGTLAWRQGDYGVARRHFEEGLALRRDLGDERAIAASLLSLGALAYAQGEYEDARALIEEALALQRKQGDRGGAASSLLSLGNVALDQGRPEARGLYEESLAISRELGDKLCVAYALDNLGVLAWAKGDEAAEALTDEVLARYQDLGNRSGIANVLHRRGLLALSRGDEEVARARFSESLAIKRELGEARAVAFLLYDLARLDLAADDLASAWARLEEGLKSVLGLGAKTIILLYLEGLAAWWRRQGEVERAAKLFGAAASYREAAGIPVPAVNRAGHERELEAIRSTLIEASFTSAWQEGKTLALEEAVSRALHDA